MTTTRLSRSLFHFRHLLPILLASVLPGMAQNAITPTAVNTTSMWDNPGLGGNKEKMRDGSGLSGPGSVLTQGHDNNSNVNSWHAGNLPGGISGGTTGNPPPVLGQVVEFDLGANYNLSAAHIWNFNAAGFTGRGIKDVTILVSSSASGPFNTLFSTQFAQASGLSNQLAQVVPISVNNVRRVRFAIQSAWSGVANEYVGLSEVRFSGAIRSVLLDDFSAAFNTVTGGTAPALLSTIASGTHGTTQFGETVSPSIMGNNRQAGVRDGHSANPAAMTIQDGKVQFHGTASAPNRFLRYGSSVGTANPFGNPSAAPFSSGTVTPLNLSLLPEHQLLIDVSQMPNPTTAVGFVITLVNGSGASAIASVPASSTGVARVLLSNFSGMTAQFAADIDGISILVNGQGSTAATGLHVDSIRFALEDLVIDDFSAGFQVVDGGTAPSLLSSTGGTTRFGETVSGSIIGNNRHAGLRDGQSNQASMTIQDGKVQFHGNGVAQSRFLRYGNTVGTTNPLAFPTEKAFGSGTVTPLNLPLRLEHQIIIDITQKPDQTSVASFDVTLASGTGGSLTVNAQTTTLGRLRIPLSTFAGITPQFAADIDGITIRTDSQSVQGTTAANGMHIDSIIIATESLVIDDFSAGFNTVTGGTAPALLSTITGSHGTSRFGETVSTSIIGNNRQAGVRDGHSANPTAMTIQDGKVQIHGTASAPNRFLRYGSSVGTANPLGNPSTAPFSSGTVTPLNLSLKPEDLLLIDIVQKPDQVTATGFTVTLTSGAGGPVSSSVSTTTTGILSIPLSGFAGMTPQIAADIDGITVLLGDQASQGSTAATGMHIDSIAVAFAKSNNADLAALTTTANGMTPNFAAATTSYNATVPNGTATITVTPTVAQADATVKVNGVNVTSGSASSAISLNVGANTITTAVTAQSGFVKTYTLTVTRSAPPSNNADLSALTTTAIGMTPNFAAGTLIYNATVPNATTTITVTPTVAQANATVRVNTVVVASGAASGNINLTVGTNTITTVVTAQDGTTTKTYTLTVTRAASSNADLSALTTTAGALSFNPATTSYTASVPNATTSVTVTPTVAQANATVRVNTVVVASGAASGNINLTVGTNTITTIVTAQDGTTTRTYTLTVTRATSAIPPSGNVLTPSVITTSQWSLNSDGWKDNMVNGLGLIGSGSDETKLHDALSNAFTMWHAGPFAGGISGGATGTPPSVASQAIEFDLGANYNLTGAHVWNLNQAGALGRGVRGVEIFISPDASGATWTSVGTQEFTQGTGLPLAAQAVSFTGSNARRVRFAIQSAWSGAANDYVGLSEVRFRGVFAPVSAVGTNLGAIPDNNPTGREILFNVTGAAGVVKTVSTQFTFNPAHAYMSDLRVQLIAPNGTSAWIYQPSEVRANDLLGPYTIVDSGTASLQTAATGVAGNATLASGTYRAANGATLVSLNLSFGGTSPNGTWKLRFVDSAVDDAGTVSQASLTLTTAGPGKTTILRETNGHMTLSLTAADSNANYDLMRSTDLLNWTLLQSKTTNASGVTTHTDTAPPSPRGFYLFIPRP
jgi:subtilisin-like proprotein convertase family protein